MIVVGFQVIFMALISILHFINSTHALKVATTHSHPHAMNVGE
jgi:hypothetical protein